MYLNFVRVKILQKLLELTVIAVKFSNFSQNFYYQEVNRRALLSFVTFPKFSERYTL